MLLDRQPEGRIGGIIDDHHAFEIRVVEPGNGIERCLEHLGRLPVGRDVDRDLGRKSLRHRQRRADQASRAVSEGHCRDLLHARQRDEDQRNEQHDPEPEREGGARDEIVRVPEGEDDREPGTDDIGRHRERQGLTGGGARLGEHRHGEQEAEQDRQAGHFPVVGVADQSGPGELGLARGVEHAPVLADAAFVGLPRLVEGFDHVVVDTVGFRPGGEVTQHGRLLEPAGIGIVHVVAAARPAELGDHDPLAGMERAQLVVGEDRLVDRLACRKAFPVGQHMGGDEIHRRGELGMIPPGRPDFTGGDWDGALSLDALDDPDQLVEAPLHTQVAERFSVERLSSLRRLVERSESRPARSVRSTVSLPTTIALTLV